MTDFQDIDDFINDIQKPVVTTHLNKEYTYTAEIKEDGEKLTLHGAKEKTAELFNEKTDFTAEDFIAFQEKGVQLERGGEL